MTTYADGLFQYGGVPVDSGTSIPRSSGRVVFVDGTYGSDGNNGATIGRAYATIQFGVTQAGESGTVIVLPKLIAGLTGIATPYIETVIIPATHRNLTIMGVSHGGPVQGGLPQMRAASATATITVRAPGCRITGMGLNGGGGGTGPGILLDDDSSTKAAFGTTIDHNHFLLYAPSATLATAGGAITIAEPGNVWDTLITDNRFDACTADVVLLGTSNAVPTDMVIARNNFSGPAASVSCNLYLGAGSGITRLIIKDNVFPEFPTAGGTNAPVFLTGCVGMLANNSFGGTGKTYGAAANVKVPTTMAICGNYQDGALIART